MEVILNSFPRTCAIDGSNTPLMVRPAYAGSIIPVNIYGTCRPSTGMGPSACVPMTQEKSIFWAISTRIPLRKSGLELHLADFGVNSARTGSKLVSAMNVVMLTKGVVALMRLLLMPFFSVQGPVNRTFLGRVDLKANPHA